MYVPAPLPVSLCPVNANCIKHEVKTGSKRVLLLPPSSSLQRNWKAKNQREYYENNYIGVVDWNLYVYDDRVKIC